MFIIENLHVSYGELQVLWGVSLKVPQGSIVALLGSNGAGKTTTLKTAMGMMKPTQGRISFRDQDLTLIPTHKIVNSGLFLVPEWRGTFATLSVLENLELGAFPLRARPFKDKTLEHVFELFPRLHERQSQRAGTLSGGERQMVAIGRALMAKPDMLMLDEPSLGLAPLIVQNTFKLIERLCREEGLTVLVVEQNVNIALGIADYGYILENGAIVGEGTTDNLLADQRIQEAYLGI
ncbi:MAG: ABC transporter ATP-binding protein [Anaerolineae bacterium]|nr:ABC transporter ATP-binding protein [Anaerolineae bacterium]